jgi:hypothetical protein
MMSRSYIGAQGVSVVCRALVCVAGILLASDAGAVTLSVSSAPGGPGDTVEICVDLATEGEEVAGVQTDVVWNPACAEVDVVSCRAGDHDKPLHKSQRSPSRLRAIILALDNLDPIPDGSRLFCCDFHRLEDGGEEDCRVSLQNVHASDSVGNRASTGSYAGAILSRGSPHAPAGMSDSGSMEAHVDTDPIQEKVVTGGAGSQAPVVAVGAAPSSESAGAVEVVAAAPEEESSRVEVQVNREAPVRAPAERPIEDRDVLPSAGEAVAGPAGGDEEPAKKPAEAVAAPTAEQTRVESDKTPGVTLTPARATMTAVKTPTQPTPAKAKVVAEEKPKKESACQVATGTSSGGGILLLICGLALAGLRRLGWTGRY